MKALIKNIKITERVRKEITKIDELAADIKVHGLLNPITVMSIGNDEFRLLAGLRRLKAIESMGINEIDVNIVSPTNAEAELQIEISENEQREPFTFSEKMDFARLIEEIETARAQERMLKGKNQNYPVNHGTQGNGKSRDIIGSKIGMSGVQYERAKYITDNACDEVIEELDKGKRSIRGTYDELRSKFANTHKSSVTPNMAGLLSKEDEAAIQRNKEFNAMPPLEKVKELQRQLKKERVRAAHAESELARVKELLHNAVYHKDGIINNLQERLAEAETQIKELKSGFFPDDGV